MASDPGGDMERRGADMGLRIVTCNVMVMAYELIVGWAEQAGHEIVGVAAAGRVMGHVARPPQARVRADAQE